MPVTLFHKSGVFATVAFVPAFWAQQNPIPVDPTHFWQWVLQQGGMVTAVGIFLYFWRRDALRWQVREQEIANQRVDREKEIASEMRSHMQSVEGNNRLLIDIVRENSAALAKSAVAIERLVDRK